jgi:hypothetical protein
MKCDAQVGPGSKLCEFDKSQARDYAALIATTQTSICECIAALETAVETCLSHVSAGRVIFSDDSPAWLVAKQEVRTRPAIRALSQAVGDGQGRGGSMKRISWTAFESWTDQNSKRLDATSKVLDILQKLVVIIGIPWSIYSFIDNWNKERVTTELQTYVTCKDLWWKYLEEYSRHADTNFGPFSTDEAYDEKVNKNQDIVFANYQFTLFERCFLFFYDKSTTFREEQWIAWKIYIVDTFRRERVREKWRKFGSGYDRRFQKFVNDTITSQTAPATTGADKQKK